MEELWKDIPGYEGIYEASTTGRIRTVEGKTTKSARFDKRVWKQRVLKPKSVKSANYRHDLRISLWKDGNHRDYLVARLVAMTWCDGYSDNLTVNHIDGDYLNNSAENLEWVSLPENIKKGFDNGLFKNCCNSITLVDSNGDHTNYRSMSEASKLIGRSHGYISNAIKKNHRIIGSDGMTYGVVIK